MANELTVVADQNRMAVMPVMDIETAVARYAAMKRYVGSVMEPGRDYGVIPGTGDKPVLLKPGAEKLTTFFGLSVRFRVVDKTEDWSGAYHDGEPFFYYWFTCQLCKGENVIAEADGSCNSREAKFRYRKGERVCPACGVPAIIKGRREYGGGWLCFAKKGGCGAKFQDGDQAIEGQQVGRILNPDIADQVNTIQKMAQKRAFIAATLLGVNASDFFTQDLEDFVDAPYRVIDAEEDASHNAAPPARDSAPKPEPPKAQGWNAWPERGQRLFWARARDLGLSNEIVHRGAGVVSMTEYAGTMDDALVVLSSLDYAVNKSTVGVDGLTEALGEPLAQAVAEGATFEQIKGLVDEYIEEQVAEGADVKRQEVMPI